MNCRKISDLQLAAYLVAVGYPLARVEGLNGKKVFVFEAVPDDVIYGYYREEDRTSARRLFNAFRDLKGLTYQLL